MHVENGSPYIQCDNSQHNYWDPNQYTSNPPPPSWEGKHLFRTSKQLTQADPTDAEMFLPSVQEYLSLFDRFALGSDMGGQIGASYPFCRASFEKAFLGVYYSIQWYNQ